MRKMIISFAYLYKAVSDRVFAYVGLLLTAPVFLIVAILLKIRREPIFFHQKRVGQHGKPFKIYKFTTMFEGAEKKGTITTASDLRVTSLGKFLRKTKINELPQLLNVLKGEMSFIGPRPLPHQEFHLYPPDVQEKIVTVKPGITGFATLQFIEEEALLSRVGNLEVYYAKVVMPRKGQLECYYVDCWSLLLDLKIFWQTIVTLIKSLIMKNIGVTYHREAVAVVGMGYVGLTLATVLADKGFIVYGYDTNVEVVRSLNKRRSPIFEPGVDKILKEQIGKNLSVSNTFPCQFQGTVIICVSTPVDMETHKPNLNNLCTAAQTISENIQPDSLIIVRSTVPVGTSRHLVAAIIQAKVPKIFIAFCPERTIQGKALREIVELPQIVSGIDKESLKKAAEFFSKIGSKTISVSSLEAAEMVKLINNCHTDVIYSYGNEVALMAEKLGLDAWELIRAANEDYPRPNLARPGFVGGGCLSKDPYLLLNSFTDETYSPQLIPNARQLNEYMPIHAARTCLETLLELKRGNVQNAKVLICGFAYKGVPPTNDTRGSPAIPIVEFLQKYQLDLYGHDFMVKPSIIKSFGVTPVDDIATGFRNADAVIFLNDHPGYHQLTLSKLVGLMRQPALMYDSWRILDGDIIANQPGIRYIGIGFYG